MLLSPIFLALGRGRDERAQRRAAGSRPRPSRRSSTTSRSSAAALILGADARRRRASRSASSPARSGHLLVQLRPLHRLGFRYTPRIDLDDPQARKALVLMAPRAIGLGATPDHVHRGHVARVDPRRRRRHRLQLSRSRCSRSRSGSSACRSGSSSSRRCRARPRSGARTAFVDAADARPAAARLRDDPDRRSWRRSCAPAGRRPAVRRAARYGQAGLDLTADDARRVPRRARRRTR